MEIFSFREILAAIEMQLMWFKSIDFIIYVRQAHKYL